LFCEIMPKNQQNMNFQNLKEISHEKV